MYSNDYYVTNDTGFSYPNNNFNQENVTWVRQDDRFGGSVFVPLILGGAVGYLVVDHSFQSQDLHLIGTSHQITTFSFNNLLI